MAIIVQDCEEYIIEFVGKWCDTLKVLATVNSQLCAAWWFKTKTTMSCGAFISSFFLNQSSHYWKSNEEKNYKREYWEWLL